MSCGESWTKAGLTACRRSFEQGVISLFRLLLASMSGSKGTLKSVEGSRVRCWRDCRPLTLPLLYDICPSFIPYIH